MAVHIVLHPRGADVVVGAEIVAVAGTRNSCARSTGAGPLNSQGTAVIGIIVGILMEVAEGPSRRGSESERERRRDAEATIFGHIAPGDVAFIAHDVQAERGTFAEPGDRPVDVEG